MHLDSNKSELINEILKNNPSLSAEDFMFHGMINNELAVPQWYTADQYEHFGFETMEDMCDCVNDNNGLISTTDEGVQWAAEDYNGEYSI